MKNLLLRLFVPLSIACLIGIGLGWPELHAQTFGPMRQYLESRDALTRLKARIESRLLGAPVVMPLASESGPLDLAEIHRQLKDADRRVQILKSSQDPLAGYYRERLEVLLEETRGLLPVLEKRMALSSPQSGAVSPLAAPMSISKAPVASPVAGAVAADAQLPLVTQSQPVVAAPPVPVEAVAAPEPPNRRVPRKDFFSPIGIRTLLSSAMRWFKAHTPNSIARLTGRNNTQNRSVATAPVSLPPNGGLSSTVAAISSPAPVSVPALPEPIMTTPAVVSPVASLPMAVASNLGSESRVQPVASPAGVVGVPETIAVLPSVDHLPESTDVDPLSMTPMEPAAGDDPQIHQRPGMRPIAIMIENHNQARPQTGIEEAEVVYEIPVEGGITRFMALFYHVAGVIGPVRSCRDYFVDRALEVNALYVHCGGSPQGYSHITETKALAIDEISSGEPYFRDNSRKAPHNLYTKMKDIIDYMSKKWPMELPYQRLPLRYGSLPTGSTIPNHGVTIRYHGNYSVAYRFDPQRNVYTRYMNGTQHLDRVSLRPVAPGTVLVQEAVMKVIDDKGRQDISFIGKGRGWLLHGGTVLPVLWEKKAIREFTTFTTENGDPVIFAKDHPVWFQVVSPSLPVAFDPPLPGTPIAQAPVVEPTRVSAKHGSGASSKKNR